MDITNKYRKMCQTEDIQSMWHPVNGDFFYEQHGRNPPEFCVSIWINDSVWCYDNEFKYWLPRQDQLQDMLSATVGYRINELEVFYDPERYCTHEGDPCRSCRNTGQRRRTTYGTMEQWWLGFVMYKRFNKEWDATEEKWVIL